MKSLFFDADGTILDIEKGLAPDVLDSFSRLVARGHQIFLCTGRSRALVPQELEQLPFTGMITNLGAYIEYKGKPVYTKELSPTDAAFALRILRDNHMIPVMEGSTHMYYDLDEYTTEIDWYANLITKQLGNRLLPIRGNEFRLHINKISAKVRPNSTPDIACKRLSHLFDFIFHEGAFVGNTIECIAKGHSKGLSLAILCGVLGIDVADTIAFGDSNNDLSMFGAVRTKVAMGDCPLELRNAATYVTDTMAHYGISKALDHLNLI